MIAKYHRSRYNNQMKKLLVTSALPYANGPIHLGHLVEYIQTDIFVRFQKMRGNECHYVCADDTHGTPIMLSAKRQGITPEELIAKFSKEHQNDFAAFHIEFDMYSSTNTDKNRELSEAIYTAANEAGVIAKRTIEQLYCDSCSIFLPDRFVKGTCPKCNAEDQYGDNCEVCASTYSPTDLKHPKCAECSSTPTLKESLHYFFELGKFEAQLKDYIAGDHLEQSLKNKMQEWFKDGLRDWDISRDAPYFGFKIPGTTDKYFYVWMDAPVGYISGTYALAEKCKLDADAIWRNNDYEIHHFIGKDILYFHALFWPAMLQVANYKTPTKINVHGFLTVNGEKMSKSRGTFILARTYLEHLNPELLRYYYASKLNGKVEDIDLNLEDFVFKVNADVVNKVVNIGSRLGSIIQKKLDLQLSTPDAAGQELLDKIAHSSDEIATFYNAINTHEAMKRIMLLADDANKYINDTAPWDVVKENPDAARQICTAGINALKMLSGYLTPVLPELAKKVETYLNIAPQTWATITDPVINQTINPYERLAERIDKDAVAPLVATN
ncbi:MAG: methionine--tRNA ligase [bacterium]|nr:methionine--tRNA ligase [bacterium]